MSPPSPPAAPQHSPSPSSPGQLCHAIKYLILGCDYLLECVHPSLGFLGIFQIFLAIILIFPIAKSIYLKALKSFS
jgi:hypothetical protein